MTDPIRQLEIRTDQFHTLLVDAPEKVDFPPATIPRRRLTPDPSRSTAKTQTVQFRRKFNQACSPGIWIPKYDSSLRADSAEPKRGDGQEDR